MSLRDTNKHAAWCSNYEFEDVICEVDEVDRLAAMQLGLLDRMVKLGHSLQAAPDRHRRLKDGLLSIYRQSLAEHRCPIAPATVAELLAAASGPGGDPN